MRHLAAEEERRREHEVTAHEGQAEHLRARVSQQQLVDDEVQEALKHDEDHHVSNTARDCLEWGCHSL